MRRQNPLDWFTHEKVAAEAPSLEGRPDRYQIPREVDPQSMDPGERALAGILSVAGSVSAKVVPLVGRAVGRGVIGRSAKDWVGPPIQGVRSMQEAQGLMEHGIENPTNLKNRILGLLDVNQTHPSLMETVGRNPQMGEVIAGQYARLGELTDVVDSYITKHDLSGKGVRINMQKGPISGLAGGSYMPPTKEVYLPHLGPEVALHELGHAADYTTRMGKVRSIAEPILSKGVLTALPVALAAGDHIKEMIPGTVDDKAISFMQDHAPGIMAATLAATTLYPEAKASISAIRHIRELERAGRQPAGAAMTAAKRLAPLYGSYLLGAVPAVVGMVLARKYMREARAEKRELQDNLAQQIRDLEKTSGVLDGLKAMGDVGMQIGKGAVGLIQQPNTMRRIGQAAKDVGTSPEFIRGALGAAIPATLGALYMYGTSGGEEMRTRLHPETQKGLLGHGAVSIGPAAATDEKWRSEHPARFAGLVGIGAALSGGIMSRLLHDLTRVL